MKTLRLVLAAPFLVLLYAYRWLISPGLHVLTGPLGGGCRFEPTCSRYAIEALKTHPLHRALWLIVRRLGRCHPWGGEGVDPVPPVRVSGAEGGDESAENEGDGPDGEGDDGKPEKEDQ